MLCHVMLTFNPEAMSDHYMKFHKFDTTGCNRRCCTSVSEEDVMPLLSDAPIQRQLPIITGMALDEFQLQWRSERSNSKVCNRRCLVRLSLIYVAVW